MEDLFDEHPSGHDRRHHRTLTDEDVRALAEEIAIRTDHHPCRFQRFKPEDVDAAIIFAKNMNRIISESKGIAAKTVMVLIITGLFGVMVSGFIAAVLKKLQGGVP